MLRLLTINAWHGQYPRSPFKVEPIEPPGSKERRTAALLAGVRELDPDVILMQECMPQPDFSRRVAAALGYDEVSKICNSGLRILGRGLPSGIGAGEGLAVLAKRHLGLRPRGVKRLSGFGFTSSLVAAQVGQLHFALAAEVRVGGRPVVLVNTHLRYAYPSIDAFHRAWEDLHAQGALRGEPGKTFEAIVRRSIRTRDAELARLAGWIEGFARRGLPVILGADLNLDHDAAQTLHFVDRLGLLNVLPSTSERPCTWDPLGNPNIAYSLAAQHPDGTPKPLIPRLVAHYDAIPQCPDHLMLGPTFRRECLREGGLALDRPYDGVLASDHYGVFAEVRVGSVRL
jgi:hypothetical protein